MRMWTDLFDVPRFDSPDTAPHLSVGPGDRGGQGRGLPQRPLRRPGDDDDRVRVVLVLRTITIAIHCVRNVALSNRTPVTRPWAFI